MAIVPVPSRTRLDATYELRPSPLEGDKPLVALLHGLSHTRDEFARLVGGLNARAVDCATVDIQTKEGTWFRNLEGMRSYVRAAGEALEKIEFDTRRRIDILCGHSMGGRELQLLAEDDKQWLRPKAFLAPVPFTGALPATRRAYRRDGKKVLAMIAKRDVTHAMRTDEDVRTLFFDDATPAEIVTATRGNLRHTSFRAYAELGFGISVARTYEPTLLVRSDTDELFWDEEYAPERAQYGPHLEEFAFPRGGHDFFIEHADATADVVATFAKKHA